METSDYKDIISTLDEKQLEGLLSTLDEDTRNLLLQTIEKAEEINSDEAKDSGDVNASLKQLHKNLDTVLKAVQAHNDRLDKLHTRLDTLENEASSDSSNAQSGPQSRRKRVAKAKAKKASNEPKMSADAAQRKHSYRFGTRNLQVIKPSENYPTRKEARSAVDGKLDLFYIHGYSGNTNESRINMYLTPSGNFLIYYLAAAAIVLDLRTNVQRFFLEHNDDLTCICVDPRKGSTLVASGQKDPKDEPGQGKDLPKIWVWDCKKMKKVQLIDNVCWGKISKLAWSATSGFLYCVCGDDDQTLKAYDSADFGKAQKKKADKKKNQSSMDELLAAPIYREKILGLKLKPKPDPKFVDEIVFYGVRKFSYGVVIKGKKGLELKTKAVATLKLKKDGEKAFTCCQFLPDGNYLVGATSGSVYICHGSVAISAFSLHSKAMGEMVFDTTDNKLYTAGNDRMLKRWSVKPVAAPSAESSPEKKKAAAKKGAAKDDKSAPKSPKKASVKKVAAGTAKKGADKKGAKKGPEKKGKPNPFTQEWAHEVDIAGSDLVMLPKAMQLDSKNGRIYVGTKTNQIMVHEMKSEESSVVVDGHDGAVWGLCTHPETAVFATGSYDNAVKIWDAQTMKCTWTYEFEERTVVEDGKEKRRGYEICCGAWSPDGKCVVFGTEDSNLAVFQYVNESEVYFQEMINIAPKSKNAEVEAVSYLRFSSDGELLAAAHMDANLYMFDVEGSAGGRILLNAWPNAMPHVAAPINVQFSEGGDYVKTFTRDYEVAHWSLNRESCRGKFVPTIPDPNEMEWSDDPLIAGWDVEGLYQPGWDGTDLNDATVTSDGRLVASGDDYGKVRLHNYPAIAPESNHCYGGHAEFVVGVEFLRDDSQLITCGGEDMAIFQWMLHKKYAPRPVEKKAPMKSKVDKKGGSAQKGSPKKKESDKRQPPSAKKQVSKSSAAKKKTSAPAKKGGAAAKGKSSAKAPASPKKGGKRKT